MVSAMNLKMVKCGLLLNNRENGHESFPGGGGGHSPGGGIPRGVGGDSHIKRTGTLVENFEKNP